MGFEVPPPPPQDRPGRPSGTLPAHPGRTRPNRPSNPKSSPNPPKRDADGGTNPRPRPPAASQPTQKRRGCGCWWSTLILPFLALVLVYLLFPPAHQSPHPGHRPRPGRHRCQPYRHQHPAECDPPAPGRQHALHPPRPVGHPPQRGRGPHQHRAFLCRGPPRPGSGPRAAMETVRANFRRHGALLCPRPLRRRAGNCGQHGRGDH